MNNFIFLDNDRKKNILLLNDKVYHYISNLNEDEIKDKINQIKNNNIKSIKNSQYVILYSFDFVFCQSDPVKSRSIFFKIFENSLICSFYWNNIVKYSNLIVNKKHKNIVKLLAGYTVNDETLYNDVFCLSNNQYLLFRDKRNYEIKEISFDCLIDDNVKFNMDGLKFFFKKRLNNLLSMNKKIFLLFSGGTDSYFIFSLLKHHNIDFYIGNIHGKYQKFTEKKICEKIIKEENFRKDRVYFFEYETPIEENLSNDYQKDYTIFPKIKLCKSFLEKYRFDVSDVVFVTGELGDQLYGGPKTESLLNIFYYYDNENLIDKITNLWINMSYVNGKKSTLFSYQMSEYLDSYEEIRKKIKKIIEFKKDIGAFNTCNLLNFILKGHYRLYAYDQKYNESLNWYHFFLDNDIIYYSLNLDNNLKYNNCEIKYIQKITYKKKTYIPWQISKQGLGILTHDKISKF